jgi:hypothetical protein
LGYTALGISRKHWEGWNSYQKPFGKKQFLNFGNPEQNTKVQRNKHKHIRMEREHLQN